MSFNKSIGKAFGKSVSKRNSAFKETKTNIEKLLKGFLIPAILLVLFLVTSIGISKAKTPHTRTVLNSDKSLLVGTNALQADRDEMIMDCTSIASMAQQYYYKPAALNGGGKSFKGWKVPDGLRATQNGVYFFEKQKSNSISIVGVSNEIGKDGINPGRVIMDVSPDNIDAHIVN